MSASNVEFKVGMTCEGCSNAIQKIFSRMDNIDDVQISIEDKKVVVKGTELDPDMMLTKLKKWGDAADKEVALVSSS